MSATTIEKIAIELGLDPKGLKAGLKSAVKSIKDETNQMKASFQRTRERWEWAQRGFQKNIGKMKISELITMRKKLQNEFNRKLKLDVSARSLDVTRTKLGAVNKAIGDIKKQSKSLKSEFLNIKNAIAGAFVVAGIRDMVKASNEEEQATLDMNVALKNTGRYTPQLSKHFESLADEIQRDANVANEAVKGIVALNATLTDLDREGLDQAIKGSVGLAHVFKIDVKSAATLVAKALAGNVGALSRYGIQVDKNLSMEEKRIEILRQLGGMYEQAREGAKSDAGAMKQLSLQIGDLKEKGGDLIKEMLVPLSQILTKVIAWLNGLSKGVQHTIGRFIAFIGVLGILQKVLLAFGASLGPIGWVLLGLGAIVTGVSMAFKTMDEKIRRNINTTSESARNIRSLCDEYETLKSKTKLTKTEKERLTTITKLLNQALKDEGKDLDTEKSKLEDVKKAVDEVIQKKVELLEHEKQAAMKRLKIWMFVGKSFESSIFKSLLKPDLAKKIAFSRMNAALDVIEEVEKKINEALGRIQTPKPEAPTAAPGPAGTEPDQEGVEITKRLSELRIQNMENEYARKRAIADAWRAEEIAKAKGHADLIEEINKQHQTKLRDIAKEEAAAKEKVAKEIKDLEQKNIEERFALKRKQAENWAAQEETMAMGNARRLAEIRQELAERMSEIDKEYFEHQKEVVKQQAEERIKAAGNNAELIKAIREQLKIELARIAEEELQKEIEVDQRRLESEQRTAEEIRLQREQLSTDIYNSLTGFESLMTEFMTGEESRRIEEEKRMAHERATERIAEAHGDKETIAQIKRDLAKELDKIDKSRTATFKNAVKEMRDYWINSFVKSFVGGIAETVAATILGEGTKRKELIKTGATAVAQAAKGIWSGMKSAAVAVYGAIANIWKWLSSKLGPLAVPIGLAAGYGLIRLLGTVKSKLGLARGTRVDRPVEALIGEAGPEIVAPEKDFLTYSRELIGTVVTEIKEGLHSFMKRTGNLLYEIRRPVQDIIDTQKLVNELRQNSLTRPGPAALIAGTHGRSGEDESLILLRQIRDRLNSMELVAESRIDGDDLYQIWKVKSIEKERLES